ADNRFYLMHSIPSCTADAYNVNASSGGNIRIASFANWTVCISGKKIKRHSSRRRTRAHATNPLSSRLGSTPVRHPLLLRMLRANKEAEQRVRQAGLQVELRLERSLAMREKEPPSERQLVQSAVVVSKRKLMSRLHNRPSNRARPSSNKSLILSGGHSQLAWTPKPNRLNEPLSSLTS